MSDYPNMSYCMNQNTLLALHQVIDAMRDQGAEFIQDLSREERRAYQELFHACEDFLTLVNKMEVYDSKREWDGQPDEAQEWHDFDPDC